MAEFFAAVGFFAVFGAVFEAAPLVSKLVEKVTGEPAFFAGSK